jgi:uncharacterized membrane protein YgdD (TMEM256/DUF423 family)
MPKQRNLLLIGSLLGGLAVALGAFGSHLLKSLLTANEMVEVYELANRYHLIHALVLLLIALMMDKVNKKIARASAWFILTGTVFFSGSLYLMAVLNTKKLVYLTPLGGSLLLIGWGMLFYSALRKDK